MQVKGGRLKLGWVGREGKDKAEFENRLGGKKGECMDAGVKVVVVVREGCVTEV